MNHYNEALDYEKRALSRLVENSFYPHRETSGGVRRRISSPLSIPCLPTT